MNEKASGTLRFGAGPGDYEAAVGTTLDDPGVDALMVSYVQRSGGRPERVLAAVREAWEHRRKPIVASIVGADGRAPSGDRRAPNFVFPEARAAVLARTVERRRWMSRPLGERLPLDGLDPDAARALIDRCLDDGKQWLTLADGEELLATHGIELEPAAWCNEIDQAFEAAAAVGGPVAMKAGRRAPETPADFDAVPLGVEGEDAVRAGWLELLRRTRARRARLDRRDRAAAGRAWR